MCHELSRLRLTSVYRFLRVHCLARRSGAQRLAYGFGTAAAGTAAAAAAAAAAACFPAG